MTKAQYKRWSNRIDEASVALQDAIAKLGDARTKLAEILGDGADEANQLASFAKGCAEGAVELIQSSATLVYKKVTP